jgi:DNA helicase HerA-like ATPase
MIRAIDTSGDAVAHMLQALSQICAATLELQKYVFQPLAYRQLAPLIKKVGDRSIRAVVKEEHLENLQNTVAPVCYSFAKLNPQASDLSRIVHTLTGHPNCAVSFQLLPTSYTAGEIDAIEKMSQTLSALDHGIYAQNIGNLSVSLAGKHAELYRYYAENRKNALFLFNIIVSGAPEEVADISSQVYGHLIASNDSNSDLRFVDLATDMVRKDDNFYPLPWAVNEILIDRDRNPGIWNGRPQFQNCYRLPYIVTAEEASVFFRLPVGSGKISAGLSVNDSSKNLQTYADGVINGRGVSVGRLKASSGSDQIGFEVNDLARHMLVVGTPGSGKTTFLVGLMDRLWKRYGIPFLVIEPAKNEYRAMLRTLPDLQIFTPGKNDVSPFLFNPFMPPEHVKLETYKSTLKTAFSAAVSMASPLNQIFEQAIDNCYSDFRWLDNYTSDDQGAVFNISDFIRCFQETFDAIGYTGDAKNIGRAGVVRLKSLMRLFDHYSTVPIADLLKKPTLIELNAIENSDQKALIISLLLLSVQAYVNANYSGEGGLKNVILLEEAHTLLASDTKAGEGEADPSGVAQGLLKRMLAEIRSYGVGLVIADQSPRKVSADVVALTDIKLAFRLVEAADKQIVADSTNMTEQQTQRLSRLKTGEAFFFFNRLDDPEEVETSDYRLDHNIRITLPDQEVKRLSTYWNDKPERLRPYPECAEVPYCKGGCSYERRILAREIARRIYIKNFKPGSADFSPVEKVFAGISKLVTAELNNEPFSRELLSCVKVHLWRQIKYNTKIPVTDVLIGNSLRKA